MRLVKTTRRGTEVWKKEDGEHIRRTQYNMVKWTWWNGYSGDEEPLNAEETEQLETERDGYFDAHS